MIPDLETPRLYLKPLVLEDAPQIQRIFPQWEIVKYLNASVPWPYPPDGAITFVREVALPEIERAESWYWTLRLKRNPRDVIGLITLSVKENHNRGFWIDPSFQGEGLMTEACDAVTEYWFNVLGFAVLRVPKAIVNEASRRISLRQGMRVISREDQAYVGGKFPSETWEITAEEWNARKERADRWL